MSAPLVSRIDSSLLALIVPAASGPRAARRQAIISAFGDMLPDLLQRFEINTPLRIPHFLAQVAHESDGFQTTEEYASGKAYETRTDLGNTAAVDGDGPRYKGHGLIQLTGRENHRLFTAWMRKIEPNCPDFDVHPELAASFPWAGWTAFFFWSTHHLNDLADTDDVIGITKIVNGGRNGLASRSAYLRQAKIGIAMLSADALSATQRFAVLRRGMAGAAVEGLQRQLAAAGFYHMAIDGFFGAGTEQALRAFQAANNLVVDGIAGALSFAALGSSSATEPT